MEIDFKQIIQTITILGTVGASLTSIFYVFWWLVQRYNKSKSEDIKLLKEQKKGLEDDVQKIGYANVHLVQQLKDVQQKLNEVWPELKKSQDNEKVLRSQLETTNAERAKERANYEGLKKANFQLVKDGVDKLKQQHSSAVAVLRATGQALQEELNVKRVSHDHLQVIFERIKNISSLDGKLWNRPVLNTAPPFRPRRTAIISILNLKGGVGKTTITANLGATLADRGKKVLMIDLDFQRSLSRLLLSTDERKLRHLETRCVQHFFSGRSHDGNSLMKMVGEPIADLSNCWFLPNSDSVRDNSSDTPGAEDDSLEETEMRLMIDWIFERDARDIRFHLREALHDRQMDDRFHCVLLDCPPRLTTACINALAASDYVLVPVTLDAMATNSVPYLLKSLDFLKRDILPQLEILGVVANRVKMRSGSPEKGDRFAWENLTQQFEGRKPRLRFFETKIQENAAIGKLATRAIDEDELALRLAIWDEKTKANFDDLVDEIEKVLAQDESHLLTPVLA